MANIFIAQTSRGLDSGMDADNAHSIDWLNTISNWGSSPGNVSSGDTIHLVGTLSTALIIRGSGTEELPITILFESGAKFSAPVWTLDGAIQIGSNSYIIIDGGNSGTLGARATVDTSSFLTNIECTANGTALANQAECRAIYGVGGRNIVVRNLAIRNMYVRTPYSTDAVEGGIGISLAVTQNLLIENCFVTEGVDGISVKGAGSNATGIEVRDCTIINVSNGVKPGCQDASSVIVGTKVLRCRIDGLDVWNGPAGGSIHHCDGIQLILGNPGMRSVDAVIAYNWIGPNFGTSGHTTSAIFCEDDNEGTLVYNNFVQIAAGHWTSNPAIQVVHSAGWVLGDTPGLLANNTVVGTGASSGIGVRHAYAVGNVISNVGTITTIDGTDTTGAFDYNIYWGPSADRNGEYYRPNGGGMYHYFSAVQAGGSAYWQQIGYDTHSLNVDPLLNDDGTLQVSSPAIGFAPSQSSIFNDDFYGNLRGTNWDAGAFQFTIGSAEINSILSSKRFSTQIINGLPVIRWNWR